MNHRSSAPILPWVVWGIAVFAYAVAIVNRTSLAALGPATQHHFGIDATTLSSFAMLQLVVYAGLQIPVGSLLDRYGSSVMITAGTVLMMSGQVMLALASEVPVAILARIFVGAGDACIFISVMRMLPNWFSVRQLPTVAQATGLCGQAGQLVSVVPLAWAVSSLGWVPAFIGVAAAAGLAALLSFVVIRDAPGTGTLLERSLGRRGSITRNARSLAGSANTASIAVLPPPATDLITLPQHTRFNQPGKSGAKWLRGFATARLVLSIPGVRLAYWIHFTLPFAANVFVLLWGTPFLTGGMGLTRTESASLLSLVVVSAMIGGMTLGPLSSRFVVHRVTMSITICVLVAVAWCTVLLWPGVPPVWVLAVATFVMALGGPGSMISFEVLRSHTPVRYSGFATGLVNTGGFTATLIVVMLIGLLLDAQGAGSPELYTREAFVWAFAVQIPVWALGITMMLIEKRKTGRWMREHGRSISGS